MVCKEANGHHFAFSIYAVVLIFPELFKFIRNYEFPVIRIFFFHYPVECGEVFISHGIARKIILYRTIGQSHREISIRVKDLVAIHLPEPGHEQPVSPGKIVVCLRHLLRYPFIIVAESLNGFIGRILSDSLFFGVIE